MRIPGRYQSAKITSPLRVRLRRVRLVVCDVDGVLTDGGISIADSGEITKRFDIHDGLGIAKLIQNGIDVVWLSGDAAAATAARAAKLGVRDVRQGVGDKAGALEVVARDHGVSLAEILYIADDALDLEAMSKCGVAVAVASAVPDVVDAADLVTRRPGGFGAVREAAELLLEIQGR